MEPLSKKIQLGVIVLALELLRKVGIPFVPRLVAKASRLLGFSRKTGYESARDLREILLQTPTAERDESLRRENHRLRIEKEILAFERDHPGVRFANRDAHLPPEARALCVRVFRDMKGELKRSEIAEALGVPLASLLRWCEAADPQGRFPEKPERRGTRRRAGPEDVERVIAQWKSLEKNVTLEEFTASFQMKHPDHPLDRKTITRILEANGMRKAKPRKGRPGFHPPFEVHFPGAQVSIDGHHTAVVFTSEPKRSISVLKEVGIDIASGAILGDALRRNEDSQGVEQVLVKIREECRSVLAVLSDNGSGNRAAAASAIFEWSEDARIFSFPYHPQTNGHIEGLFGQFVRIVGRIEIDDSSKERLAASIVELVWRVFIHFHNHAPRTRLGGQSPLEYLRRYAPKPPEVEAARKALRKRAERSRESRKPHPRLGDPVFRSSVERILGRHGLRVEMERAVRALLPYDLEVLTSASDALFVQSQRDGFDERKRSFAYFLGIVRNKQGALDEDRRRSNHLREETARKLAEVEAHRQVVEREWREERQTLRSRPEDVVLWNSEMLLRGGLRLGRERWVEGLREAMQKLHKLGRLTRAVFATIERNILSWGRFSEALRKKMVQLVAEEWARLQAT